MEIRIASEKDAMDIQRIYAPYVEKTCITFEYDIPTVEQMRQRISHTLERYPYLVAYCDDHIVGYAYASPLKERLAYSWASELSIYIDEDYHHQGIASELYRALLSLLKMMNIQTVYACITHPNQKSESFHQKFGFHQNALFSKCGYKFHQWLDVIWMEKVIGEYGEVLDVIPFSSLSSKQIEDCINKSYVHQ